jgi:hypothetical protein
MPFVIGVVIGFGIGFAGAILMAPEKKQRDTWPAHMPRANAAEGDGNHHDSRLAGLMENLRERVNEATQEAREAKRAKEREMMERYERSVGRKSSG